MKQIADAYGDKVRFVFRDNPLPMHNRAMPASEAAACAHEQSKFWEFHDKLFAAQQNLQDADFTKHATDLGLNLEQFNSCYSSGKYRAELQATLKEGGALGVTGTPAFFINGRFLSGAQPFDAFKTIIDDELSK
jgi:protein-disulfide isomerase